MQYQAPGAQAGTRTSLFYRIDSTKVTLREYLFGTPWFLYPLAVLIKLFHIPLPSSTDDPPIAALVPFEVEEEALPEEVRRRFSDDAQELEALGFGQPVYHAIPDVLHATRIYWATFLHPSGRVLARIHHRVWLWATPVKTHHFPFLITPLGDGNFLISCAGKQDLLSPPSWQVHYHTGISIAELWRAHQQAIDRLSTPPLLVEDPVRMREVLERQQTTVAGFHVSRRVFKPLTAAEQQLVETRLATLDTAETAAPAAAGTSDEEVLAQLQQPAADGKRGWLTTLMILAVSLILFVASGLIQGWKFLLYIIPILAFHELGHYLAMRFFGYRNIRMFFIPFLGAAVTGKHYNVAGWKKAIISLMGPVPGILLGVILGLIGKRYGIEQLYQVALLLVTINGFNLLPLLPLDGGWVLHTVLFSRHPYLDIAFRAVTILLLLIVSLLAHVRGLIYFMIPMLIALPAAWQAAKIAYRLRDCRELAVSADGNEIPVAAARTILQEIRTTSAVMPPPPRAALQITNIFETLNARPPRHAGYAWVPLRAWHRLPGGGGRRRPVTLHHARRPAPHPVAGRFDGTDLHLCPGHDTGMARNRGAHRGVQLGG